MIPFEQKLRGILKKRKISIYKFSDDTGINRENFFYRKTDARKPSHRHSKYIYMAIAYYLDMTVEDLVEGTEAEYEF